MSYDIQAHELHDMRTDSADAGTHDDGALQRQPLLRPSSSDATKNRRVDANGDKDAHKLRKLSAGFFFLGLLKCVCRVAA